MNPNKRILNPKNNPGQASPWLLCPSKSFPGKFYYFNGQTGETAWCLSETDKNLKKGPIHRVTDKAHTYPEPFDPPDDSPTTSNSFSSLKNTGNTDFTHNVANANVRPSPVFGQAVFPKYVPPDIFAPKFVWTLTPMYMPSQMPQRQMMDQVIQTIEPEPVFLQTSMPYNNRFPLKRLNFAPVQNSTPLYFKDMPMYDKASNFNTFKMSKEPTFSKPPMKDEACQTFVPIRAQRLRTKFESDLTTNTTLIESRSVENLTLLSTKDIETSTLSSPNKVDNGSGQLSVLDKNDLRFKLVAKKKKVEYTAVGHKADKLTDQSKYSKREGLPKKRVTFDFPEPETNIDPDELQVNDQSPDSPQLEESYWYVAADTETLLSGLKCIEEFVISDTSCRLLVPYAVYSELESRGRGDSGAISARQLLRRLAAHDNHVIVQDKPEVDLPSEDSILECCWSLVQEGCYVVLVTNNKNITNKAKSIDLECYTTEEIKMNSESDSVPQNDKGKLKIIIDNDNKKSVIVEKKTKKVENIFLQDLRDLSNLCLRKPNGFSVRPSRMNIFNNKIDENNELNKTDTYSDKLINLTRLKNVNTIFNSEITKVKNQIVKLSITENSPVQNQTKEVNNVFRNTGVSNKTDHGTTTFDPVTHFKNNSGKKNIDNNINQNRKRAENIEIFDEINLNVRRLNVTEDNKNFFRDTVKVSGITKLNNELDLVEDLKRFCIKNSVMEGRIKSRIDEWLCRLNQIMEGVLTDVLLSEKIRFKKMMPPWNLFEAIQVTGETYKKHNNIKSIIDQFSIKLLNSSSGNGKLKKDIKPHDFMKLVGLSVILIEHLKEIVIYDELSKAAESLDDLIKNIEDPETDIDLSLEKVNTPMLSRSDISDSTAPITFRKSRSEVIDYLTKHFEAWQCDTNVTNAYDPDKEPNILVTWGKNLNTLKINNNRVITVENNTDKAVSNTQNNRNNNEEVNVNQPKVIRNVKIIEAFEERIKNKQNLDVDELDHKDKYTISNNTKIKSEKPDAPEYDFILDDLSVSESSADTGCVRAYPLAKIFLVKVKGTLIRVFNFINKSIHEYRDTTSMEKKAQMKMKTELARQYLLKISERMNNIIAKESGNGTALRHLLIKAGDYVENDTVMANYKNTVTKFVQQAQILQEVLEHMLSLYNALSPKDSDITYCPSFDTPSPILPARSRSNVHFANGS